jgi:hypothetical protein
MASTAMIEITEPRLDAATRIVFAPIAKLRARAPIGEHDVVALRDQVRGRPVGTTGAVIEDRGESKLVGIGEPNPIHVHASRLRLLSGHSG